jgi:hypothetical protein
VLINNETVYKQLTEPAFRLLIIGHTKTVITTEFVKRVTLDIEAWEPFGVLKPVYILVSPDNYIGLIADEMNDEILKTYLQYHCCFTD